MNRLIRYGAGLSVIAATLSFATASAYAGSDGITIDKLAIEKGRLVFAGSTPNGRQVVTVDKQFSETSNRKGAFEFSLVYLPSDCIINMRLDGSSAGKAVVANCGPTGPAGADAKIDRATLLKAGLRGPRGPRGPQGVPGPRGPKGAAGAGGDVVQSSVASNQSGGGSRCQIDADGGRTC